MSKHGESPPRVVVVGLGYVGLPLAVALARHHDVLGFDIDPDRVNELAEGYDRTGEVPAGTLGALRTTADASAIAGAEIYIVAVPTPVDPDNRPNLAAVRAAARTVGGALRTRQGLASNPAPATAPATAPIVVFESTVYPGVTEEVCGPELAAASGLAVGRDVFLGYSPERINPGDREHTVDRITKVVAGQTPEVADRLAALYGSINGGNIFVAKDIRTAEAAKVIENAQRDINIAFVNEVAMIFDRMGLSTYDVLDAARTKWNFLNFTPGLVGGHCIGVDPYYLAHAAQTAGHDPEVILAGRRINDGMGSHVADRISALVPASPARLLVLGLTFKENVPDLRNSRVVDVVRRLQALGHRTDVYDPVADHGEAQAAYGIEPVQTVTPVYDAVVLAVGHAAFRDFDFSQALKPDGLIADIKGFWHGAALPAGYRRWSL